MRLFTALDPPPAVAAALDALIARLRPTARIKWSPAANLHITTKFIGEWPEERLPELRSALAGIAAAGPIRVSIRKLGFFPNPHNPRSFWAGIDAGPGLHELAAATDRACAALGIAAESRPYSPHLTLARIKGSASVQALREAIARLDSLEFGTFDADRFHLYRSELQPSGSVYTKISEFPLT